MSANITETLYSTKADEDDESRKFSEIAKPQIDSLVESPSVTRATIQASQSDSLHEILQEKYRNAVTRVEVMMNPANLIAFIFACGLVIFTKAEYEQVRRSTCMISKLSRHAMNLPCYSTLKISR
jgi:pantoate kinase